MTNLQEIESGSLAVFPNPATDYINSRVGEINGPQKVYLTNTLGQKQLIAEVQNGEEEVNIDLRDVSPGFYYLHLHTQNQGYFSTPLIIQK
ncbi:MAG: T9SS C-terminal target domain-containing protein [Saprospirales bacterium]|nr:MAG: T9SS C-terminal target domain-containing protein [Saprospirales bacterium]